MHGEIVRSDTQQIRASLPDDGRVEPPPTAASSVPQEAYEAIQKMLADLHHEIMSLCQTTTITLAVASQVATLALRLVIGGGSAPMPPPAV